MSNLEEQVKDAILTILGNYEMTGESAGHLSEELVKGVLEVVRKPRPSVTVKRTTAASSSGGGDKPKGKGSRVGKGNYYSRFLSLVAKLDKPGNTDNYESVDDAGLTYRAPEKKSPSHDGYQKELEEHPEMLSEDFAFTNVRELYAAISEKFPGKERMWRTAVMWTYYVSPLDKKNWQDTHPATTGSGSDSPA